MNTAAYTIEKELKNMHFELLQWKSNLEFKEVEIQFLHQLLNSYIFEPNTPNLFEKLQEYKTDSSALEQRIEAIKIAIAKQENQMGGILECDTTVCDNYYKEQQKVLQNTVKSLYEEYQNFKTEVFRYAGSILKSKKK